MITPAVRARVSAISFAALVLAGACARGPAPRTWNERSAEQGLPIRFDNTAQTYVDVYFVTPQRQWRLGRVAPGARTTLQIPGEAIAATSGFARLAVLAGAPITLDAAHDPRATFTIAQPAAELLAQRWTFSQRQEASPELLGAPSDSTRR
jgi:hypothetical protein